MKIDYLFACNNPGSFNVLFPVIKEIAKTQFTLQCYIVDFGKEDLVKEAIPFKILDESYNASKIRQLLEKTRPSVLVTGSSFPETFLGKIECRRTPRLYRSPSVNQ